MISGYNSAASTATSRKRPVPGGSVRPDEGKGQQGRWGFQGGATLYVAQSTRVDREWTNPELDSFCVCVW